MATQDAGRFLALLEERLPCGHDMLLWLLHGKTDEKISYFVRTARDALLAIESHGDEWHVFYGIGTRPHQTSQRPSWRGKEQDVIGLFGAHIDIDIASPLAHKVSNLPPDISHALLIVNALPLQPTVLVHSGYGLHALYFFKELEVLDSTADRIAAKEAVMRLQGAARAVAQEKGWVLDATHDLSRVLRLPGTINRKSGGFSACHILSWAEEAPFYPGLSTFLDHFPPVDSRMKLSHEEKAAISAQTQDLDFSDRYVNPTKFETMKNVSRPFSQTWEKERHGMRDYSQSGYDMALACIALKTERWTIQEVASLIIQYRAKYGRTTREAYLHYTLQQAYAFVTGARPKQSDRAVDFDAAHQVHTEEQDEEDAQKDDANAEKDAESVQPLLRETAELLHFPEGYTVEAVYVGQEIPLTYTLLVRKADGAHGRIMLDAPMMYNMTKLYEATWRVTQNIITTSRNDMFKTWAKLFNRLKTIATPEPEDDTSMTEVMRGLLRTLASHSFAITSESDPAYLQQFIRDSRTYLHEGSLHFSLDVLFAFGVKTLPRATYTMRDYADALVLLGATQRQIFLTSKPRIKRRRWNITEEAIDFTRENVVISDQTFATSATGMLPASNEMLVAHKDVLH